MFILPVFYNILELHEKSLKKVLDRNQRDGCRHSSNSSREMEMTVALAEHLLGQLSPGQLYIIDSSFKSNGKCSCGEDHCKSSPKYGSNGIGKNVYYIYSKILFLVSDIKLISPKLVPIFCAP